MRIYGSGEVVFQIPKNFTLNSVEEFLKEFEIVFKWKNRGIPKVELNFKNLQKINLIGLLLIYKVIDFTHNNYCFKKPMLIPSSELTNAWNEYHFWDLINAYISNKEVTEKAYKDLKIKVEEKFILAPQALLRNNVYTHQSLQSEFFPKVSNYYGGNERIVTNVFTCLSEVLLNFWEHAVEDTKSIIIASGNRSKVEIACADTGKGIISTLRSVFPDLQLPEEILAKALCEGVTSKRNTFHMGFGLWIVNQIVTMNNSRLHIYSEGAYYKNDYGKITKGQCGFWNGTIIYINLDITNPVTPYDFNLVDPSIFENLKINFL